MLTAWLSLREAAGSTGRRVQRDGEEGQAAMGPQTLISAAAVRVARRGPPGGKPSRALVLRSRCRPRSTTTRRRARPARMCSRPAVIIPAGMLAVAAPARVEVMTAACGGERYLTRVHRLAGALALACRDRDRRGGAGCRAGQFGGGYPGGVLLGDQGGGG